MNLRRKSKFKYLIDGRLEDVLALIQVLALDTNSHRSEEGLNSELSYQPKSADTWVQLAKDHQEFFRVVGQKNKPISLVIRHVSKETGEKRPPLTPDYTQSLLNTAIELHDRQLKRNQRWTVLIPIWVAVIGGIFLLLQSIF